MEQLINISAMQGTMQVSLSFLETMLIGILVTPLVLTERVCPEKYATKQAEAGSVEIS